MCDYSLQNVRSRPAKVGDKLTTRNFSTGTRGFAAAEDAGVAVCVLPGMRALEILQTHRPEIERLADYLIKHRRAHGIGQG